MAQIPDIRTNLQDNNTYWKNVADAIDYCGKDSTDGVATYGDKIKEIKDSLDTEIDELENTKLEYESNFSDINSAILSKGQTPSGGYDTYAEAILNIESGEVTINLQSKEVEPTTNEQTITPDSGYNGLSKVVVGAVDSSIDSNIVATNIKKNVEILGVVGTYEAEESTGGEIVLQDKTVVPTIEQQRITCDNNYDGLGIVTVNAVDNTIDTNIKAENIKSGISILGVNGTYEATGGTGNSFTISNADYICYKNARSIEEILPILKDCISFNYAFNLVKIPNGQVLEIDMGNVKSDFTSTFSNSYIENGEETTIKILLGTIANNLFNYLNNSSYSKDNLLNISFERKDDTVKCTDFTGLFSRANYIKSIDFGNIFDNIENCIMESMFNYINAPNLELDLSKIDFTKISDMSSMFYGATVKSLKFNDLNIVDLQDINSYSLFYNSNMPISEIVFNLKNCNLQQAFSQIKNTNIKVNITDTSDANLSVIYKDELFRNSTLLTEINTDSEYWELYGTTTRMFYSCSVLTKIPKIKKYISDNNTGSLNNMYAYCPLLEEICLEMIHTENHTATGYTMQSAFQNDTVLKKISGLDMSYVNNVNSTFAGCSSLITIETTGSFGGKSTTNSLTLDLSASDVFDATSFINSLASNESGKTRIIKLHATVLDGLSDETKALATTKNYTLQ